MKYNEDELQKELKELKISGSINQHKKESMKWTIKEHARKKRRRRKYKQVIVWASTAAALFLACIVLFHMIDNNQSVLPADDHGETEHENSIHHKQSADTSEEMTLSVHEGETEKKTIIIEGMEEEVTVTNYVIEPYGIHYQMEEFLNNFQVEEDAVKYSTEAENAWIRLEVAENTLLDEVISDMETQYTADFYYKEEPTGTSQEENQYEGITQHFSDPPQGYYAYQIGENVLIIQYEYTIEAGDGMGPRLQALRKSIK